MEVLYNLFGVVALGLTLVGPQKLFVLRGDHLLRQITLCHKDKRKNCYYVPSFNLKDFGEYMFCMCIYASKLLFPLSVHKHRKMRKS